MEPRPYAVLDGGNHWYFFDRYGYKHAFLKLDYNIDDVRYFAIGEQAYDYDRH